ncbi:hypothetical protein B0J12DRAFT_712718 [Macrophomina phaseolina]|uniref:DUF4246 domain-containing protein n=1 Tax=Macrophomina phaseolina TaxID=35725 RepID=A0ABQ8G1C1_9PEZI|nr:hypothetical protein B0J12DRAFT_712718 [Macrophomina phaseolina]
MLTPDKPRHAGGSWHVKGQLNERYYGCGNITESHLAFQQRIERGHINSHSYEQDNYGGIEFVYGVVFHDVTAILASFLVGPWQRVLPTENVASQQKEWWTNELRENSARSMLPEELAKRVLDKVGCSPMDMYEEKKLRRELMEERKEVQMALQEVIEGASFNLYEQ